MKKIVILTGTGKRHTYFRKFLGLSKEIHVISSWCEKNEHSLSSVFEQDNDNDLRKRHLVARDIAEEDFFGLFIDHTPDHSNPVFIPKGQINSASSAETIIESAPDLVIAYGCSIIREPLLSAFAGRFLNVHLGLSPYYRGSGTNFWPLVNAEPEYVGATFMYIDAGIDTGEIIHQIRPRIVWGDTPANIGNRLIRDMAHTFGKIIINFDALEKMRQIPVGENERVCKQKDFTEDSAETIYENFRNGLVDSYLAEQKSRCTAVPIIENPAI